MIADKGGLSQINRFSGEQGMFVMKQIPHRVFAAFLRGEQTDEVMREWEDAKQENPAYRFLAGLIEKTPEGSRVEGDSGAVEQMMPHSQMERIMTGILNDSVSREENAAFIQQLMVSPAFYQRCLGKIDQMQSRLYMEQDTAQMAKLDLRMQPVSKLLNVVEKKGNTTVALPKKQRSHGDLSKQVGWWEKLKAAFPDPSPILKPAMYAGPALALLLIAGLWITSMRVTDAGIYDQGVPHQLTSGSVFDWQQPLPSGSRSITGTENVAELSRSLKAVLLSARDNYQNFRYQKVINDLEKIEPHFVTPLENAVAAIPDQSNDSLQTLYRESRQAVQEFHFFLGLNHLAYSRADRVFPEMPEQHLQAAATHFLRARQLAAAYAIETGGRESKWLNRANEYMVKDQARKWF